LQLSRVFLPPVESAIPDAPVLLSAVSAGSNVAAKSVKLASLSSLEPQVALSKLINQQSGMY